MTAEQYTNMFLKVKTNQRFDPTTQNVYSSINQREIRKFNIFKNKFDTDGNPQEKLAKTDTFIDDKGEQKYKSYTIKSEEFKNQALEYFNLKKEKNNCELSYKDFEKLLNDFIKETQD